MIERVSELPLFGPEEQLWKFISQTVESESLGDLTQRELIQQKVGNIDLMLQNQLIWSVSNPGVDDAYFYWDWVPDASGWKICEWFDRQVDLTRPVNGRFSYSSYRGYTNSSDASDEMPQDYDSANDEHAISESDSIPNDIIPDKEYLRNAMRSYIEVSEWKGDGATQYGSHNGYVSRKMSLRWLFDAIRALINYKMNNQDRYAEKDIHPLDVKDHNERFLNVNETSDCGVAYPDADDLAGDTNRLAIKNKVRSSNPDVNGTLVVRGNEWHYGERADFYTHNSFIGECRFFHKSRFIGQAVFDKEIIGTAMRSRWADLAEYYESDRKYTPGTLIMFGGEAEVTESNGYVCNGIVTTNPGLKLNCCDEHSNRIMVGVALTGKVPVKVFDNVKKFDKLVASYDVPGYARKKRWYDFFKKTIGIAIEDSNDGKVMCVTKLTF